MPSRRALLLGTDRDRPRPDPRLAAPALCFALVFAAYAVGLFEVTGGVIVLPGDATVAGMLAAAALAARRSGLVASWATVYAALLGHRVDHYLLGLSGRSPGERFVALLGVDGLAVLAAAALALGTLAWVVGTVGRLAVGRVRAA
ncbi:MULTISPECIES: hypothetical protein [Halorubrum]|uniref:Uncharacterized protein n=1 Tax=Halorubrum sodomense TaxID=35743 RepID=A0A1I6FKR1_HALSD|nr:MULTISPECIES: hypothetical protein [Halorubrum]TKX53124.1 hypothetical protein EXE42_14170 [Halorubrum sp. SP3]TKX67569.1 hypothetical protein EXE45_13850 [Halorubrum sp. SP9]SFR30522.1 hypothetical protein SAMN04487937_0347 [Halorubrum sodomense]